MTAFTKILGAVRDGGESVCVYRTTSDSESFIFGRVLAFNEDDTAMYLIAPGGAYDGVEVFPTKNILRIDRGGQYIEKMGKLTAFESYAQFGHALEDEDICAQLLSIAEKEHRIISLELLNSGIFDVRGFVREIGEDGGVSVGLVDEYGCDDGISTVLLEDITEISYYSEDEQVIQRLWEKNREAQAQ